jgi:NADH dehydrogenase
MSNTLARISDISQPLISTATLPTLILGGGFMGLFAALHLSHQHYKTPTIPIDREWNFIFTPLLY